MIALPNPFTDSAADRTSPVVDTAVASSPPPAPVATANHFEPSLTERRFSEAPAVDAMNPHEAAGATDDYIPELFSSFARRRCMPIISPPLQQQCRREFQLDEAAFFDAILPPEPPPIFLRSPSQAFIRALFELSR
jgi:hypothetical protein